ncbi:sporulation protein [Kitasatospora sp. NPDC088783]|uniref:sporulation protein n=1 Tax=Kitasatospora sp. NPDC088783 TaxID=3364077 RepID=UPI0037FBDDFF
MPAGRRTKEPNRKLGRLIEESGASHAALSTRINQLAARAGVNRAYSHTSIVNWTRRGMRPKPPAPALLAAALGERLGRPVTLQEIGMADVPPTGPEIGFTFSRDTDHALRIAAEYWRTVDRRDFLSSSPFAVAAFATPFSRWLSVPADPATARLGGRRVGRADLDELWAASEEARAWDSRCGGGNWKSSMVTECLRLRAAPLLEGTFTEAIGSELFAATAELARVAAWSAVDMGDHTEAQRQFVQALRMARASGDVAVGSYVLATMSLQAFLRGYPVEAVDMAEGAYERAKHDAPARVLAFAKLAQARAHGRAGDAKAAAAAIIHSEQLVDAAATDPRDPAWLAYLTRARIAADAAEIHRDLHRPKEALRWHREAAAMPSGVYTRAVGIQHAVIGTAHLQNRDLEPGLESGELALRILGTVRSTRARDYLRRFTTALDPWGAEPIAADFLRRARTAC